MNRRDFIRTSTGFLAGTALASLPGCAAVKGEIITATGPIRGQIGPARPNIVVILADDLGYAELGVQGCKDVSTPNIDSIANNGVRFTNGYVSCPLCSPTRAGLMMGRYQQRFGHEFNPGPPTSANETFTLPKTEITLAERMRSLGYATGMFGKWHLGFLPESRPLARGFEEFYGFLSGMHDYFDPKIESANYIYRGNKVVRKMEYTTDEFASEAVSFIERKKNHPFFLYLPFNAVHAPLQTLDKYRSRFQNITDKKRQTFAGMLSAMDDGVGKVLATIRNAGIEENTLIFFLSDNGGPTPSTTSSNIPLRGYKGQIFEGGIRIPFMMQWKGQIPAGQVMDNPIISLDIHPTAFAAAGGTLTPEAKFDGVDLMPLVTGKTTETPHEILFWRHGKQTAVRKGDWKLLVQNNAESGLYNLSEDIAESNDLSAKEPYKLKELQTAYDSWNAQLMAPRRQQGSAPKKGKKPKAKADNA